MSPSEPPGPFCNYSPRWNTLDVYFPYDPHAVEAVRRIPGARGVPPAKGGWYWKVPASLDNAQRLRQIFGERMLLTPAAKIWGKNEVKSAQLRQEVHQKPDAKLVLVAERYPEMYDFTNNRPFQRADIAYMALQSCVNANEPGAGKTLEALGAIVEAGLIDRKNLIVVGQLSAFDTWQEHCERFLPDVPMWVYHGGDRARVEEAFSQQWRGIIIVSADTIRKSPQFIASCQWGTIIADEFHLMGLGNDRSKLSEQFGKLKADRTWLLSGTPAGGKPLRLWAAFHMVDPKSFSSKWRWADQWVEAETNPWARSGKTYTNKLKAGKDDEFYQAHARWLIRRTSQETMGIAPPEPIDVWCHMTPTQARQYRTMADLAEVEIGENVLSATEVIAQYTRLKQFAFARGDLRMGYNDEGEEIIEKVIPTTDSGKLPALWDKLAERGIAGEQFGDEMCLIASQFAEVVIVTADWLKSQGVDCHVLYGKVKREDRREIRKTFQSRTGPRVIVLQTQTGGVSLTLDAAESIHLLDETWNPDDTRQVIGRAHARGRNHRVDVYRYLMRDSIDQYIREVNWDKEGINDGMLDLHRKLRGAG